MQQQDTELLQLPRDQLGTPRGPELRCPNCGVQIGRGELHEAWIRLVSGPQGRMLRTLVDVYRDRIARKGLAFASGQSATSSGYEKNLSTLRSLGLIDYPSRGQVVAKALLFPDGVPA